METVWMESSPDNLSGLGMQQARDAVTEDNESIVVIWDGVPDRVRVPMNHPSIPGRVLTVLDHRVDTCPKCREIVCTHLHLEGDHFVAGCHDCGFVFYNY